MADTGRFAFPPAATEWLTGGGPRDVLVLGSPGLVPPLRTAGHRVTVVDQRPDVIDGAGPEVVAVVAKAESLPFDPCQFDVVVAHQVFHRFAPGLVLSEMARVLRPGGHAALSWLVRDDSVPWVRRLVALLREIDPDAMRGDFGADTVSSLLDSKYFVGPTHREFRHWVPVARRSLTAMVASQPVVQGLAHADRERLLARVADLYDQSAPGAEALRLPYQLRCHRADVDHTELTAPIDIEDDGLVIRM